MTNTRPQIYSIIYQVIKHRNIDKGKYKASQIANKFAVASTWIAFNNPHIFIDFATQLLDIYQHELNQKEPT